MSDSYTDDEFTSDQIEAGNHYPTHTAVTRPTSSVRSRRKLKISILTPTSSAAATDPHTGATTKSTSIGPNTKTFTPTPPSTMTARVRHRPQSARPSGGGGVSSSRSTGFDPSVISSFVPTPSHLQRLKLHQSLSLARPTIATHGLTRGEVKDSIATAAAAIRKKMTLLEVERRAIAERQRWESIQAESEIGELQREHAQLLEQVAERHSARRSESAAHASLSKSLLKARDPFATAVALRSKATAGRSVQQESVLEMAAAQIARRNAHAANPSTTAVGTYQPTPNDATVNVTPTAVPTPPLDAQQTLKLRRAYDLLRHTNALKQKQHDEVANELEMMILKVKSKKRKEDQPSASSNISGHSPPTQVEERAKAMRAFNPFLQTINSLHTRLQNLMTSHNDAVKECDTNTKLVRRLEKEEEEFPVTLQKMEQALRAREVEYENMINLYVAARASQSALDGEKDDLVSLLHSDADSRRIRVRQRTNMLEEFQHFFTQNAIREREMRQLQHLKEQEEKRQEKVQQRTSRMQSRAISRMPSTTNFASSTSTTVPSSTATTIMALMPGSAATQQQQQQQQQPSSNVNPLTTALVSRDASAVVESDADEAFLSTLTPFQQTITRAFRKIEQRHRQVHGLYGSNTDSRIIPSDGRSVPHSSSSPSNVDVDLNLLLGTIFSNLKRHSELESEIERNEHKLKDGQKELEEWLKEKKRLVEEDEDDVDNTTFGSVKQQQNDAAAADVHPPHVEEEKVPTFLTSIAHHDTHQQPSSSSSSMTTFEDDDSHIHQLRSEIQRLESTYDMFDMKGQRLEKFIHQIRRTFENMLDCIEMKVRDGKHVTHTHGADKGNTAVTATAGVGTMSHVNSELALSPPSPSPEKVDFHSSPSHSHSIHLTPTLPHRRTVHTYGSNSPLPLPTTSQPPSPSIISSTHHTKHDDFDVDSFTLHLLHTFQIRMNDLLGCMTKRKNQGERNESSSMTFDIFTPLTTPQDDLTNDPTSNNNHTPLVSPSTPLMTTQLMKRLNTTNIVGTTMNGIVGDVATMIREEDDGDDGDDDTQRTDVLNHTNLTTNDNNDNDSRHAPTKQEYEHRHTQRPYSAY